MEALEVLLFPRQAFLSTGIVIRRSECSICSGAFGSCDHVHGRVYGGEFAGRVVTEAKPREVSFVETPDDKGCRAYTIESDGVNRNVLTWEEVPRDQNAEQPGTEEKPTTALGLRQAGIRPQAPCIGAIPGTNSQ